MCLHQAKHVTQFLVASGVDFHLIIKSYSRAETKKKVMCAFCVGGAPHYASRRATDPRCDRCRRDKAAAKARAPAGSAVSRMLRRSKPPLCDACRTLSGLRDTWKAASSLAPGAEMDTVAMSDSAMKPSTRVPGAACHFSTCVRPSADDAS